MPVIAVAMSGGVDSTVSAWLIETAVPSPSPEGWKIVGVSHDICRSRSCNDETLGRAERFCRERGFPYYRLPMQDEFRECVMADFVGTYFAGRTPNPCVRCNERIRFSLFYNRLKEVFLRDGLLGEGEPLYFATGHYARVERTADGYFIGRGADRSKDQSYMLYRIPKELLPFIVFPLGGLTKKQTVATALEHGFPSASVRESQDICFVEGNYTDFLREWAGGGVFSDGDIVDTSGMVLGRHRGYLGYTPGQRKGIGLGDGPWYVAGVNPASNRVVVGRREECMSTCAVLEEPVWFIDPPAEDLACTINLRYQSADIPCTVRIREDGAARLALSSPALVSPGQSGVLYRGDLVIGGGILSRDP